MKAVVTVIGKDQKGIIAKISNILFENGVNILDISQTIMQDMFTMIMLVNFENENRKKRIWGFQSMCREKKSSHQCTEYKGGTNND